MSKLVRKIINTPKAPKSIGPYNQGVVVNNALYVSGQLGLVPDTMQFAGDDVASQTHQSLKNIKEIVQSAGFTMQDVVKTTVLLADMNDFGEVNKIYEQYFPDPYPARAAYQVACLPKKLKRLQFRRNHYLKKIKDICLLKFHTLVMNKENRNSSQLWSILARAVKYSYKEGKIKLPYSGFLETNPLMIKVFGIHVLEHLAEIDENTLWLELVPRPVIYQSNNSIELPTIVSSLHIRVYEALSNTKTADSSCMNPLLDVLTGFDNTGNVHLWSSEILLAHSMFCDYLYPGLWSELYKNFNDHPIENVCELCAGMTGAAGLAISVRKYSNIFKTSYVLITDGNDHCVASISSIVEHHSKRLLDNCSPNQPFLLHMDVKNIRWPKDSSQSSSSSIAQLDESLVHRFDLIIAADCFFDQFYHFSMLNTINKLLSLQSGSTFLAISPLRGNSLHNFINLAHQTEQAYNWIVKLISPSDYLSSQLISYLIDESNRINLTDSELDNRIVVGGLALFATAVFIRFYKLTVVQPKNYLRSMSQCSPLIKSMSWGSITVETVSEDGTINPNKLVTYRDAKLWPNGSRAWDWNESGTGHFAGIQNQDVDELLRYKPNIIILSKGVLSQLKVPQSLIDYINQSDPHIKVMVQTSKKAFESYNQYAIQGERVAALIHTTC
ncbi:unnamed protein product [Schistosoma turkestanicum]|nr:unnamed protein product [Schistosoma turkestanicum]